MYSGALLADIPLDFPAWHESVTALNPCTLEEDEITIYHDEYLHLHGQNKFWIGKRHGKTSSGYDMIVGHTVLLGNQNRTHYRENLFDTWVAVDGSAMKVHFVIVYDFDLHELRTANFRFECY